MKLLFLLLSWATVCLLLPSANAQDNLNVIQTNSDVNIFSLDNIDKMTLDEESIYITEHNGNTSDFLYDNVSLINFLDSLVTAIEGPAIEAEAGNVDVFYGTISQNVTVKSSNPIKTVSIYNTLGRLVKQIQPKSEYAEISLQAFPAGLYIVSVINSKGRVSEKIIKN